MKDAQGSQGAQDARVKDAQTLGDPDTRVSGQP